jgi:hypothetical protein
MANFYRAEGLESERVLDIDSTAAQKRVDRSGGFQDCLLDRLWLPVTILVHEKRGEASNVGRCLARANVPVKQGQLGAQGQEQVAVNLVGITLDDDTARGTN